MLLTVDLAAIVANWRRVRDLAGRAECAAVVKADAYGLGADRVAPALAAAGCRRFFVATIDEGIALRAVLPDHEVFVLCGPLAGAEAELEAHRLIPVLNSLEQLALWRARAHLRGEALAAALHLDTGMSRLGFAAAELARVAGEPELLAGIDPVLAMSHMACADEAASPMNRAQRESFARLAAGLPAARLSLAASSGTFLGPDYHFDLVRPGAALYGVNPTPGRANPMAPVLRLEARILQVRDVDTPMTVGYGATHRVAGRGRIAAAAVGYADGWFRSLGNRGHGVIGGTLVPVVGRISMDLTTFDVSGLPPDAVVPGAMIELIGPGHDVDSVAAEAGTIGYEVLTALGRRAARRYTGDTA
jgi:alanine racemase